MSITGEHGGQPMKAGVALVDVLAGMNAVIGIQAALRERDTSGRGQRVQVNLLQSLLSALVNQASGALATGISPRQMGNAHPSIAPYETFATADRPLAVAVGNDRQFATLAGALGAQSLSGDLRFRSNTNRVANRTALRQEIESRLVRENADHWARGFLAVGVPAGPINDVLAAIYFAIDLGLEPVISVGEPVTRLVANPIRLSLTPPSYRFAPPNHTNNHSVTWLPKEK